MKHDYAAGGVVFRYAGGQLQILLIKDRYGHWTLPKGHLDPGESNAQAALREIAEETGVGGRIVAPLASIDYQVFKKGELRDKTVAFFLVEAGSEPLVLPDDGEVQALEWCLPDEAERRIHFQQIRAVLVQGIAMLHKRAT